jgi:ABC-2 type transport system permease protein
VSTVAAASVLGQVRLVARRSVKRTLRQPALIVPTLVFPLFLLAVNASGLSAATKIPGFPTDSYLDFAITVTFIQGAMFSAITAGTELATDISTGFLDRLQLTPLRRVTILVGQLAGATTLAFIGAMAYLTVGVIAGVDIKSGVAGAVLLVAYAVFIAVAFAGIGATLGARTGSPEAVQGAFPLMFAIFFLSSMSIPRNLIGVHWFRTVATWNPASYLIEGLRSLVIAGWDGTALWRGLAVGIGILVLSFWAASRALATRMART